MKPAPLARESRRHVDRGGPAKANSAWWSRLYLEPGDGRVRSCSGFHPSLVQLFLWHQLQKFIWREALCSCGVF